MNMFVFFSFVGLQCATAYRTYYVEDECNDPQKFQKVFYKLPGSGPDSVGELRSNRFGTYSRLGRKCVIKLVPPTGHGIVATVLKVDFRNHAACTDNVKIFDDVLEEWETLCGYQERDQHSKTFFSNDQLRVLYHTEAGGLGFHDGFRLVYTVAEIEGFCSAADQFRCANGRCVWAGVVCDGVNNCGDRSDEESADNPHCNGVTSVAIAAVVLGITSFVAIIVSMCLCCCRVKKNTAKEKPLLLLGRFPSRPNGGYLPLPGYNYAPADSNQLQPLHSSCPASAPYQCSAPLVDQKRRSGWDRPPPYSERS